MLFRTFFKHLHVAELLQVVAIVIVGDVDLLVLGQRVLHPGSFPATVGVMGDRLRDGGQGVLAVACSETQIHQCKLSTDASIHPESSVCHYKTIKCNVIFGNL